MIFYYTGKRFFFKKEHMENKFRNRQFLKIVKIFLKNVFFLLDNQLLTAFIKKINFLNFFESNQKKNVLNM